MADHRPSTSQTPSPGPSSSKKFPPPPLIDPSWKQVDEFPETSDDDEWEEEVEYLTLDLGSSVDRKSFGPDTNFQLLGLNSPTPFLKIANQFFMGTHEHLIGTELIMKEGPKSGTKPTYDPLVNLSARIRFTPVKLEPVGEPVDQDDNIVTMRHWKSRKMTNQRVERAKRPKARKPVGPREDVLLVAAIDEETQPIEGPSNTEGPPQANLSSGHDPQPDESLGLNHTQE